jgi:hypothetical protein
MQWNETQALETGVAEQTGPHLYDRAKNVSAALFGSSNYQCEPIFLASMISGEISQT